MRDPPRSRPSSSQLSSPHLSPPGRALWEGWVWGNLTLTPGGLHLPSSPQTPHITVPWQMRGHPAVLGKDQESLTMGSFCSTHGTSGE